MQQEQSKVQGEIKVPLMLILDVKTRWASTHQMLREFCFCFFNSRFLADSDGRKGRALDYCEVVDSFVSRNKDLHPLELSNEDWEFIKCVMLWLKMFQSATVEMSTTSIPMVSSTHAIFRGLQDDLKDILRQLPNSAAPAIMGGLTDAHRKLSDYYYQYDMSPFYLWAACV